MVSVISEVKGLVTVQVFFKNNHLVKFSLLIMIFTESRSFHVVDYVIFALVLSVSLSIGFYHAVTGGKQRTTKEYLLANRQLQTVPVTLSILVSFVSGILVLGTPAEMYTRGTQLFMRTIGYCLACVLSSVLFVPLFFNLKVTSSYEVRLWNCTSVHLFIVYGIGWCYF